MRVTAIIASMVVVVTLGAVIAVPAHALEVTATVVPLKLYGTATIDGVPAESGAVVVEAPGARVDAQIAGGGRFELPYLSAGVYRVTFTSGTRHCSTAMDVPRVHEMRTNLGTINCSRLTGRTR